MRQRSSTYRISFTTGGLFYREAVKAAGLYQDLQDWALVKEKILSTNLLQSRTQSSLKRVTNELVLRLQGLTDQQLTIVVNGSRQEQNQILWLAVCKQYPFVREFAGEVVREKYLHLDFNLSYLDFDAFYNAKAEWNESLEQIKTTTRKKLRQVLFLMLTEAELISPANFIQPVIFSTQVGNAISQDDPAFFSVFPVSDLDIKNRISVSARDRIQIPARELNQPNGATHD